MSIEIDEPQAIAAIEEWFRGHCDGEWEHAFGLTVESTDNPGWLVTLRECSLPTVALADIIGDLLRDYGAQVSTDGAMVRVYSDSLKNTLIATAVVLGIA